MRCSPIPTSPARCRRICSYDHGGQGGAAVKPLTGAEDDGPSDVAAIWRRVRSSAPGVAIGAGVNPEYGKLDPYAMALSVIDEAIRNVVAVGADPCVVILDKLAWAIRSALHLRRVGGSCRGCYDGALHFRTPFISGKDSLNNEYLAPTGSGTPTAYAADLCHRRHGRRLPPW